MLGKGRRETGIHLVTVSIFARMTRKNWYFWNPSQQVLSDVAALKTTASETQSLPWPIHHLTIFFIIIIFPTLLHARFQVNFKQALFQSPILIQTKRCGRRYCYGIGSFRQFAQTKSICSMCICCSLSLRKRNKHWQTLRTAHVESNVN